jgi:Domain of unknown function (DUF4157)
VVFDAGQYAPQSPVGRRLMAHELTHVVQQRSATAGPLQAFRISRPDEAAEVEADRVADSVLIGARPSVQSGMTATLAREGEDKSEAATIETGGGTGPDTKPVNTWGWGAPETNNVYSACNVQELDRDAFLAFVKQAPPEPRQNVAQFAKDSFGYTWTTATDAVPPPIETTTVDEGGKTRFKLKPTHAEMPELHSAITAASDFVEGDHTFRPQERSSCASKSYPIHWTITADGAAKIKAGEQEHCDDIRVAFDLTLGLYASGINNVAAAERVYTTKNQAIADAVSSVGVQPNQMLGNFIKLARRTTLRDQRHWHTPVIPNSQKTNQTPEDTGCSEYHFTVDKSAFSNVNVHSSDEVVSGTPPAKGGSP